MANPFPSLSEQDLLLLETDLDLPSFLPSLDQPISHPNSPTKPVSPATSVPTSYSSPQLTSDQPFSTITSTTTTSSFQTFKNNEAEKSTSNSRSLLQSFRNTLPSKRKGPTFEEARKRTTITSSGSSLLQYQSPTFPPSSTPTSKLSTAQAPASASIYDKGPQSPSLKSSFLSSIKSARTINHQSLTNSPLTKHSSPLPPPAVGLLSPPPNSRTHSYTDLPQNATPVYKKTAMFQPPTPPTNSPFSPWPEWKNITSSLTGRKLPGPAGSLPYLTLEEKKKVMQTWDMQSVLSSPDQPPVHLPNTSVHDATWQFLSFDIWNGFLKEFGFKENSATHIKSILEESRVGKVNHLICIVVDFQKTNLDAIVVLKDPTGEIKATMHKKVLQSYEGKIAVGTLLQLTNISVFSPSYHHLYLNITEANICNLVESEKIQEARNRIPNEVLERRGQEVEYPVVNEVPKEQEEVVAEEGDEDEMAFLGLFSSTSGLEEIEPAPYIDTTNLESLNPISANPPTIMEVNETEANLDFLLDGLDESYFDYQ